MTEGPQRVETPPPVIDRGDVPELYIDGYHGATFTNGVVKLNLYSLLMNAQTNETERRVVTRLAVPLHSFISIHASMGQLLSDLEKVGAFKIADASD